MKHNHAALTAAAGQRATPADDPAPPTGQARELCAAVLVAEAGGTSFAGMQAVWEVIHQRAINRKLTHEAVVKQRWQFSCLNKVKPAALIAKARRHRRWDEAFVIVAAKPRTNYTKQADHYHADSMITFPHWARGRKIVAACGRHLFYRLKK